MLLSSPRDRRLSPFFFFRIRGVRCCRRWRPLQKIGHDFFSEKQKNKKKKKKKNLFSSLSYIFCILFRFFSLNIVLIHARSIIRSMAPCTTLLRHTTRCACGLVTYFHNWRSNLMDLAVCFGLPVRPRRVISRTGRRVAARILTPSDIHRYRQALTVAVVA